MDSNDFVGMIMADSDPAELQDAIKQMLYNKTVNMIDDIRPLVASQLFDPSVDHSEE
jgi:hypothetical protein